MFGRRFFGGRYYAPRYFGDGGTVIPPAPDGPPAGTKMMMGYGV